MLSPVMTLLYLSTTLVYHYWVKYLRDGMFARFQKLQP